MGPRRYGGRAAPELDRVGAVIRSQFVSSAGPAVEEFEAHLARHCETDHAIAVATGTSGLQLLMYALDCGPGDEVIVPALAFISVGWAVTGAGASPTFVDVDRASLNVTPDAVASAITDRTRGIIAVHTFGHPCDMDGLRRVAEDAGLFLIEDACEALGGDVRGRPIGGLGDAAVHSF